MFKKRKHMKTLQKNHLKDLRSSGLNDKTIELAGFYSVTSEEGEALLGFPIPCSALAIPYFGVNRNDAPSFVRLKPDVPYQPPGWKKSAKYLSPKKSRNYLYIPPMISKDTLQNVDEVLFITEGEKKALKATQEGFPCIGVSGVWNWTLGKDSETGQRHVVPDFERITWKGRTVYLCYDSDAIFKPGVLQAEGELARQLVLRGAHVLVVRLPDVDGLAKTGVDDYLIHKDKEAFQELLQQAESVPSEDGPYHVKDGAICCRRPTKKKGEVGDHEDIKLCNFVARITEEVELDNGIEHTRSFAIDGVLENGKRLGRIDIAATEFTSMNWVIGMWGARPRLTAEYSARDKLRDAIQHLSNKSGIRQRKIYEHTGWRRKDDGWIYLHAGGAIGCQDVEVHLDAPLDRYRLPEAKDIKEAVKCSLNLLEIAPHTVTVPLLSAVALAPLCEVLRPDFALWLFGATGSMKTTLATLFISHFGDFLKENVLPGSWESTGNALEKTLFILKDTLAVIDDYAPQADVAAQRRLERGVTQVVRSLGNRSGRGRMRSDTSLQRVYSPRGIMLSTGEDVPTIQSILARLFTMEIKQGDVDKVKLGDAQNNAYRLSQAMVGYLEWLAPQMDMLESKLKVDWQARRCEASSNVDHLRIPEIVAHLATGFDTYLRFATEVGAITESQADQMSQNAWDTLVSLAQIHGRRIVDVDPAERFLNVLSSLFASDAVYVDSKDIRKDPRDIKPSGSLIGWGDDDYLYLIPEATRQAIVTAYRAAGDHWPHSPNALYKALDKKQALMKGNDGKNLMAVNIYGNTQKVLKIPRVVFDIKVDRDEAQDASDGK
jgi:hypothetical protein